MHYYMIAATVYTRNGEWTGSRQIPMFILRNDIEGIVNENHAARIAREIINPLGLIADADLIVTATQFNADWT